MIGMHLDDSAVPMRELEGDFGAAHVGGSYGVAGAHRDTTQNFVADIPSGRGPQMTPHDPLPNMHRQKAELAGKDGISG